MAKLKEILPLIAAGVAGAASPRGADVFMTLADTINKRDQQKLSNEREDQRLQSTLSLQDLQRKKAEQSMAAADKEAAERQEKINQRRAAKEAMHADPAYGDLHELQWAMIDDPDASMEDVDKYLKEWRKPSVQERIDILRGSGNAGQVYGDGYSVYVPGPQETALPSSGKIVLDIQDDKGYSGMLKELDKLRQDELGLIGKAKMGNTVVKEGELGYAEQAGNLGARKQQLVNRMITRAAILSKGDPVALDQAISEILSSAGMTEADLAGGGQSAESGRSTLPPTGQLISGHGTPKSGKELWDETH